MALLEIRVDLKRLAAATERIAFALEQVIIHEYGIQPAPAKRMWAPAPASEDDIAYADDKTTLRQELEQLVRPGDVKEREGADVEEELGDVLHPYSGA